MKKSLALMFVTIALTGCETLQNLNPFDRPPEPLKGERKEVQLKGFEQDKSIPQPFNPADVGKATAAEPEKKKK